jgi:hypothetical protein
LIPAVACFAVAAVIVLFGEGLRVVYSGGFFLLMGIIMLINARRSGKSKTA